MYFYLRGLLMVGSVEDLCYYRRRSDTKNGASWSLLCKFKNFHPVDIQTFPENLGFQKWSCTRMGTRRVMQFRRVVSEACQGVSTKGHVITSFYITSKLLILSKWPDRFWKNANATFVILCISRLCHTVHSVSERSKISLTTRTITHTFSSSTPCNFPNPYA